MRGLEKYCGHNISYDMQLIIKISPIKGSQSGGDLGIINVFLKPSCDETNSEIIGELLTLNDNRDQQRRNC